MTETFHISPTVAKAQLRVSLCLVMLVFAVFAGTTLYDGERNPIIVVTLAAAFALFAARNASRRYRSSLARIATHALVLEGDAILIKDGAAETRIPYSAIEYMEVRRLPLASASIVLKVGDRSPLKYRGYERMEALISALAGRLPANRVRGRVGHV